jgi:D-alanyl-D-alanine carboxypeptidase
VIHDALEDALAKAAGVMKTPALTASVALPSGEIWTQTLAPGAGRKVPDRFFWASVGKAYTATAVVQLVEEGKLTLDTTLERWAPAMPNARWITIEDLLCHVSGLYSFQADPALRAEPGYKAPERLLATAQAQPAGFCPGAAWSYSNTGYVLLGRIIEALDAKPYHESLKARIVDRLGLEQTTILAPRQTLAGLAPLAAAPGQADGATDDITTPFAAGAVAASSSDVVRFWRGLMANRLHGAALTKARFYRLYPMVGVSPASFYGQGVMVTDLALADPKATDTWIGHAGGLPGASAMVAYSVEKGAFVAVALTGQGSPEATANLLLAGLPRA